MSEIDKEALNSQNGENEEETSEEELDNELSNLLDEDEQSDEDAIALKRINEITGKNYKSLDDIAKSEKERDKLFAQSGSKKQDESDDRKPSKPQSVSTDIAEELLTVKHPEASEVLDELREEAQRSGKDVLNLFRSSTFYQNEAKARYEAKERERENGGKVNAPTPFIVGKSVSFDKIDLENPDHIKWLRAKDERLTAYNEWIKFNYKQ